MLLLTLNRWKLWRPSMMHCSYCLGSYRSACFDESSSWRNADWSCSTFAWILLLLIAIVFSSIEASRVSWGVCWLYWQLCPRRLTSVPKRFIHAVMEDSHTHLSNGKFMLTIEAKDNGKFTELLDRGLMEYGCSHYRRRCRIRAPCCNEIFDCRHCHNEAKNHINVDPKLRHDIPRHQVKQVICSLCGTEQEVQQVCVNCGVCMGKYFCEACKLFDDDISKKQYHCNGCGICRIGGCDNFFHCYKCGCCYSIMLKNSHPCVEGAMHHDCPVCFEFLFESRNDVTVMPCGHTIHKHCLKEMRDHLQYACPLCSKSVCDMSKVWEKYDMEIAATPMPEPYQNKLVSILCNDCGKSSQVQFHIVAQKCSNCKSYNTRQTRD